MSMTTCAQSGHHLASLCAARRKKVNIFIPMLQPLCKWTDLQRCDVFPFHDPKRPLRVPDSHPSLPSQLTNPLYQRKRLINSFSFSYFPSNGSTNPGRPQLSTQIKDKPSLNLSRSSVPNGLLIMDAADGSSCVVTSQKFAKGTRFGPLLAQKSYAPIKNIPFPLVLFASPYYYESDLDYHLQTLFNGRNVYLDTRNTSKCNWMIHVSLARFSNEQNLICFQVSNSHHF